MDLAPLIVIVVFVALIAFSMKGRIQDDRLKPPGEPGDADRHPNLDL
jgi:hypothetical protein